MALEGSLDSGGRGNRSLVLLDELKVYHDEMTRRVSVSDWKGLSALWLEAEARFNELRALPLAALPEADRARARLLVEALLERQAFVAERVTAWMEEVRPLLDSFERHPPANRTRARASSSPPGAGASG